MDLFSIGEFSRMCGLPVKTLRFYHEKGVLTPARVERETGYRYYDRRDLETARVIVALRGLEFPLAGIARILEGNEDDADILSFLESQREKLRDEILHREDIVLTLDTIIAREREARTIMEASVYEVEEKTLEALLVGGMRMRGRYEECGKAYSQLGRKLGRQIKGKAMMLCHDEEYREEDADFEPCMPLRRAVEAQGVDVRELPGGRFLTLLHAGPYEALGRSYERIMEYARAHGLALEGPCREVYHKGPGMIFKGNPAKYLTEIQFPIRG